MFHGQGDGEVIPGVPVNGIELRFGRMRERRRERRGLRPAPGMENDGD
jgi:hypothetical protein